MGSPLTPSIKTIKVRSSKTGETFDIPWGGFGRPSPEYIKDWVDRRRSEDKDFLAAQPPTFPGVEPLEGKELTTSLLEQARRDIEEEQTRKPPIIREGLFAGEEADEPIPRVEPPEQRAARELLHIRHERDRPDLLGAGQEFLKERVVRPIGELARKIPVPLPAWLAPNRMPEEGMITTRSLGELLPESGPAVGIANELVNVGTDPLNLTGAGAFSKLPRLAQKGLLAAFSGLAAKGAGERIGESLGKMWDQSYTPEVGEELGGGLALGALGVLGGRGIAKRRVAPIEEAREPINVSTPEEFKARREELTKALDFLESGKSSFPPEQVSARAKEIRSELGLAPQKTTYGGQIEGSRPIHAKELVQPELDILDKDPDWIRYAKESDAASEAIGAIAERLGLRKGIYKGLSALDANRVEGAANNTTGEYQVDPFNIAEGIYLDAGAYPQYREFLNKSGELGKEFLYRDLGTRIHESAHVAHAASKHPIKLGQGVEVSPIVPEGTRPAVMKPGETIVPTTTAGLRGTPKTLGTDITETEIFDYLKQLLQDVEGGPIYEFINKADPEFYSRIAERALESRGKFAKRTAGSSAPTFRNIIETIRERPAMEGGGTEIGRGIRVEAPGPEINEEIGLPPTVEIPPGLGSKGPIDLELARRGKGPKKQLPSVDQETWKNLRRAVDIEGSIARGKFKDLDAEGIKAAIDYQADPSKFPEIQRLLEDVMNKERAVGIEYEAKDNYLYQIWADPPSRVKAAYGRRLGLRPAFTMESTFKDYLEGIQAGLTPRYSTIGEIIGARVRASQKAIADRLYWNHLRQNRLIVSSPSNQPPKGPPPNFDKYKGWRLLDPEHFPTLQPEVYYGKRKVKVARNFFAPPKLARQLNNYLKEPAGEGGLIGGMDVGARAHSIAKNIGMAAGVPNTAINAHGLNMLLNSALFSKNPLKQVPKTIAYLFSPEYAERRLKQRKDLLPFIIKGGGSVGVEDHAFILDMARRSYKERLKDIWLMGEGGVARKAAKTSYQTFLHFFDEPLFQRVIPNIKVDHWIEFYKEFRKSGMSEWEANKAAGKVINNIFGGQNLAVMNRDKNFQNLLRIAFVAPDWMESQARTAIGMAKSIIRPNDPRLKVYKTGVRNLIAYYVGADIANYMLSGRHLFQNPPGSEFELAVGQDAEGKDRYVKLFNSSLPLVKLPLVMARTAFWPEESVGTDLGVGIRELRNRLSLFARPFLNILMNVDYKGDPITGPDAFGRPRSVGKQAAKVASEFAGVGPQQTKAFIDWLNGETGWEEALMKGFEMPLRYRRQRKERAKGAYSPAY